MCYTACGCFLVYEMKFSLLFISKIWNWILRLMSFFMFSSFSWCYSEITLKKLTFLLYKNCLQLFAVKVKLYFNPITTLGQVVLEHYYVWQTTCLYCNKIFSHCQWNQCIIKYKYWIHNTLGIIVIRICHNMVWNQCQLKNYCSVSWLSS